MSDLENFLTECERYSLAHSRRQSDIYFDELIHELLLAATQRKEKHLAEIESGLGGVTK